jgi:prepilin-type N-terminal cleavage/methylation domain-containing protein
MRESNSTDDNNKPRAGLALSLSNGFTLMELLLSVAIISLLASVVLSSLSSARKSARDMSRASEFDEFRKAFQAYITDNKGYPGDQDNRGVRVSPDCAMTDVYADLADGGYLSRMPSDPVDDPEACGRNYDSRLPEDGYFYGWDSRNPVGDLTIYCFSINRFESGSVPESLQSLNWKPEYGFGPDANLDDAEFVYCFTDKDSVYSPEN